MISKTQRVRAALRAGDTATALSIAKDFRRLSRSDRAAIGRAHEARLRPDFYRQLGLDPEQRVKARIATLIRLYASREHPSLA